VTVANAVATVNSAPLVLRILVIPTVLHAPQNLTVPIGGMATFSIAVDGTLPMGYRWRLGSKNVAQFVLDSHVSLLTITNVQSANAGRYTVVLTNEASFQPAC